MSHSPNDRTNESARTVSTKAVEYHQLLASQRRRLTIEALHEHAPSSTDLETLATAVATRENSGDAPSDDAVVSVTIDLHHVQLPMLAEHGVLEYDRENRRVDSSSEAIETLRGVRPGW